MNRDFTTTKDSLVLGLSSQHTEQDIMLDRLLYERANNRAVILNELNQIFCSVAFLLDVSTKMHIYFYDDFRLL